MNPIPLSREIHERYKRYLLSTFRFKDETLRQSFENALDSQQLVKGPFLEATPAYLRALTPRTLFPEIVGREVSEDLLRAVDADRPLYRHQEEAIRKVAAGRNVVVATGTGSGKTEAFLYPILLDLVGRQATDGLGPGVRALILYPMNALAMDQRDRLGLLRAQCPSLPFTFGQYIGETPEDESDGRRDAAEAALNRRAGELVLREEMRRTPPHLLLTNYSMLEYLLLRPDDSPLFDGEFGRTWHYLVLDEAHQYRGSRGIEMGMLLRRLKQRLRVSGAGRFQCIATSATLMGGAGGSGDVAQFASDLFGEPFSPEDVVLQSSDNIPEPAGRPLEVDCYRILWEALANPDAPNDRVREVSRQLAMSSGATEPTDVLVSRILQRDSRAVSLRRILAEGAKDVAVVAGSLFGELETEAATSQVALLVDLMNRSTSPSGSPQLSARYHFFLRALEGAYVRLHPSGQVVLDRKVTATDGGAFFETALCRQCGQHYFVGVVRDGKLSEAVRDPSRSDFGVRYLRPVGTDSEPAGGEDEDAPGPTPDDVRLLCQICGAMGRNQLACGHDLAIQVVEEVASGAEDREDQVARCGACGYAAGGKDPVREVAYGTDGPHVVIASTLHEKLPEGKKKILAFADGRQEAAYFAWYLGETYKEIATRSVVLGLLRNLRNDFGNPVSLTTLADRAFLHHREAFASAESDDEPTVRSAIWRVLYREWLTEERRISLEGVGLVRWSVGWPSDLEPPAVLLRDPWGLDLEGARRLVFVMLDTLRRGRIASIPTDRKSTLAWEDLGFKGGQMRAVLHRSTKLGYGERQWAGKACSRATLLARVLRSRGLGEDEAERIADETLSDLAQTLTEDAQRRESLVLLVKDGFVLDPRWWRIEALRSDDTLERCALCGSVQGPSLEGVCRAHHCKGRTAPVQLKALPRDHYRELYSSALPTTLRVEEHTAQLASNLARRFQRDFKEGRINVLSCSTTFELGVDLGDLDTVFLRNAPPEAFNYAQRVGRAGRRAGHTGFAVTYCRRAPHDLYHFARPEGLISGLTRTVPLVLANSKIILRHVVAMVSAEFFRSQPGRFKSVLELFGAMTAPSLLSDLHAFLTARRSHLEEAIRAVAPSESWAAIGLDDGSWVDRVLGIGSRLDDAVAEVADDCRRLEVLRKERFDAGDDWTAKWAGDRRRTIERENVLSFLSRKAIIPKYGFPVDVVELDTQPLGSGSGVSLQRDLSLAIAEFAPGSEVVANKRVWASYGLKRVAEREWDRWWYSVCSVHGRFEKVRWTGDQPPEVEPCCKAMRTFQYLDPRFGFVTLRAADRTPSGRPHRGVSGRPFFAGFLMESSLTSDLGPVLLHAARPGSLVTVCEGPRRRGFTICSRCGAGIKDIAKARRGHQTPFGRPCPARLAELIRDVSLGHEFVTDVLQIEFLLAPSADSASEGLSISIAYALLHGAADVLQVPSSDLNVVVSHGSRSALLPTVLYDDVPGGAGLVARLADPRAFRAVVDQAIERVSGTCGCDPVSSCYGCLRSYRNQFAHDQLQRGAALDYLSALRAKLSTATVDIAELAHE
jgi:hypothetical protein